MCVFLPRLCVGASATAEIVVLVKGEPRSIEDDLKLSVQSCRPGHHR